MGRDSLRVSLWGQRQLQDFVLFLPYCIRRDPSLVWSRGLCFSVRVHAPWWSRCFFWLFARPALAPCVGLADGECLWTQESETLICQFPRRWVPRAMRE